MVDIAAASSASSQIQVDAGRSGSQENAAVAREAEKGRIEDSMNTRKALETSTEAGVGKKVNIQA